MKIELEDLIRQLDQALDTVVEDDHIAREWLLIDRYAVSQLRRLSKTYHEGFGQLQLAIEGGYANRVRAIRNILGCGLKAADNFAKSGESFRFKNESELLRAEQLAAGYGCTYERVSTTQAEE